MGDISFAEGFLVRECFWNIPGSDVKTNITLEEVLSKLCGKKVKIDGKLEEAIEKENKERNRT